MRPLLNLQNYPGIQEICITKWVGFPLIIEIISINIFPCLIFMIGKFCSQSGAIAQHEEHCI